MAGFRYGSIRADDKMEKAADGWKEEAEHHAARPAAVASLALKLNGV